jgi:hypothetical protein
MPRAAPWLLPRCVSTTDANLKYQQNLGSRRIAVLVLMSTTWPRIQQVIAAVVDTIESASVGTYVEVQIP